MSDILQDAKNLYEKSLSYEEWWDLSRDMWPDLVSEIKRLREDMHMLLKTVADHEYEATVLHQQLAAKDDLNNDLMENRNQRRNRCWKAEEELARWQKIATEEKAKANTYRMVAVSSGYPEKCHAVPASGDLVDAAKELQLRVAQESSYVERLEAAFLDMWKISLNLQESDFTIEQQTDLNKKVNDLMQEQAQAALAKIREGK